MTYLINHALLVLAEVAWVLHFFGPCARLGTAMALETRTGLLGAQLPARLTAPALLLVALLLAPTEGQAPFDGDLLLALKETFSNGYFVPSSWGASPEPCDGSWLGIQCSSYADVTGM